MSKMEFNKEGLFLLAKKMSNQNYSLPKNILLKSGQIPSRQLLYNSYIKEVNTPSTKDFIVNESEGNNNQQFKKSIKFKNKFLEKNNIQINEEKMLHLLSERKRKMKQALSHGDKIKKIIGKNKVIYINLENSGNNNYNNINKTQTFTTKEAHKFNTKFEKNNTYNENIYNNMNENMKIEHKKILFNSNSDYFTSNLNKNFISDRKSMKLIGKNIKLNLTNSFLNNNSFNKKLINHSRNDEQNNKNLISHFYSNKKIKNINIEEINEENNEKEDNKNTKNNINNNININININSNISNANYLNNIKKIENKKSKKSKKAFNRLFHPKKYISFRQKTTKDNQVEINDINNTDHNLFKDEDKSKERNNLSGKIMKKYVSHKIYYLKDIKNNGNSDENNYDDEEEVEDNNDKVYKYNEKDEREMTFEGRERNDLKYLDYNTYNINVNFISDQKNNLNNVGNIKNNNFKYSNYNNRELIQSSPNSILQKQTKKIINNKVDNIGYFESPGNNKKIYSSQILGDKYIKNNNNDKFIEKKYFKNIGFKNIKSNSNQNKNSENNYNNNKLKNLSQISSNNIINNKKDIIQLEDLLILEGKFCHLFECLKYENPVPKMCVEWWNFYTYSSFFGKFPKLFPKINKDDNNNNNYIVSDYQIAHDAVMYEILSMIIIYKILCSTQKSQNLNNNLKGLINEIHQNFLIECDYILSKVSSQSLTNIWIKKLKKLILIKKNWEENNINENNFHLNLLQKGNIRIKNIIQYLINNYTKLNSNNNINNLTFFNKNISKIHLIELSGYFNKAINQENIKSNKKFSYILKKNINNKNKFISIVVPYLPENIEDKKHYTLVLDLDETLISFRFDENGRGILKMRPGLFNFLKSVRKMYEIIIFTAGTQEYADPILDRIEKNGKIFAKRLYRQHAILMNNIYIKDLTRLGRDLSKIIIIDNMPQNFCLQKENGILIKNFFGQEKYETTLTDLTEILLKISSDPNNDVRRELKKYREEIFTKITTNLKC